MSSETRDYRDGSDVRALRDELGMTQRAFGVLIFNGQSEAVVQKTISEMERGERAVTSAARRSLKRIEALHREDLPLM